jgi:hypothetical protein
VTGAARATRDRAVAARRGVDRAAPMVLGGADRDAGLKDAAAPTGAAPAIVDRMRDGADRMVLLPVVLVDREVPMVVVPAVADAVPTNMAPPPLPDEWMRSTASWIGSSGKLNL